MRCERCSAEPLGYGIWDYCAHCGRNFCDACMEKGCCGRAPADSGEEADHQELTAEGE